MLSVLRQGRYLALLAVCAVVAVGCVAAGSWQWSRYASKHDANQFLRDNVRGAAVPVGALLSPDRPVDRDGRLRKVTARGRYDMSGQVYVRNRQVEDRLGFLVVTPLRTDEGPTLLVVRGWTPAGASAERTPDVPAAPSGEVTVTGRVHPSEKAKSDSGLPPGQVDRINVPALAGRLDVTAYGGYVELVSQEPPQPAGGSLSALPEPDLSNPAGGASQPQHLAYVAQWFVFAGFALVAPFVLARLEARRPEEDMSAPAPEALPRPAGPEPVQN